MLSPHRIAFIKDLKSEGKRISTIAEILDLPVEEIKKVVAPPKPKPRKKRKPKYKWGKLVNKVYGEYIIMAENRYKKRYIVMELSRLHNLSPEIIRKIINNKKTPLK